MSNPYWAHSDPNASPGTPGSRWQLLSDHLLGVSILSRELAQSAAPGDKHFQHLASHAGLLHDLGKYSDCFQQMILGKPSKCAHAIHGAALASQPPIGSYQLAYAIAGHHAGVPDKSDLANSIRANLLDAQKWLQRARQDCAPINALFSGTAIQLENISQRADLFTRMLFSCLVDADRLDTAHRPNLQLPLHPSTHLKTLLDHIDGLQRGSPMVKQARQEVLAQCLKAAETSNRLLSLSVPTGGGKTLAAMAFALQRASLQPEYRRIIVVIPYLSIIEQNAAVYRRILGNDSLLEHHSGNFDRLVPSSDQRHFRHAEIDEKTYEPPTRAPETENWDAPCIVTTSVRFFESLFSNHPSDLRRIHNIARSIVILDEVQVLPRHLLSPLLQVIEELCRDWGCTFVLSTATKPAFERPRQADPSLLSNPKDQRWNPGIVHEIVADPQSLHTRLKRVRIDWQIDNPVTWQVVAGWMQQEQSALCIVNTREHAHQLYLALLDMVTSRPVFHLSTRMCPAHRLQQIARIRDRLDQKLPTLVVSTQLIEAGVDLDFPAVFRAVGPLDSIIQAAGRADREGRMTEQQGTPAGRLTVFLPEDNKMPPNEYEHAAGITRAMLAFNSNIQTDDLTIVAKYFERYYREAETGANLLELRAHSKFKTLANDFEMINSIARDIFVPYADGREFINELHRSGVLDRSLRQQLQPYSVGLQPYEFEQARKNLNQVPGQEIWTASESSYHPELGLQTGQSQALIV